MTEITIAGRRFDVPDRYKTGHVLKDNEAAALNQLLRENVRNNLASEVKDLGERFTQQRVNDYLSDYTFGSTGTRGDAVQTEAMSIARKLVKEKIRTSGKKLSDYTAEDITRLAQNAIEDNPKILELAEKRVKEQQELAKG